MDKVQTQIIDKVKKLLALSRSPSEAEAASALEKARVLLARYGLSMAEVEQESDVQEEILLEKRRLRGWESALIAVVSKATFTEALHYRTRKEGRILLIGREVNIVSARELFGYLHTLILILGRAHSAQVSHLESFRQGIVHRIGERLSENSAREKHGPADDERALVVKMGACAGRENREFIDRKYGSTKTKRTGRRLEAESFYRGKAVGSTINLHRQIDS